MKRVVLTIILFIFTLNVSVIYAAEDSKTEFNAQYKFIEFVKNENYKQNSIKSVSKTDSLYKSESFDEKLKKTTEEEIEVDLREVDKLKSPEEIEKEIGAELIEADKPAQEPKDYTANDKNRVTGAAASTDPQSVDIADDLFSEEFAKRQVIAHVDKIYSKAWDDNILKIIQITDVHLDCNGRNRGARMYRDSYALLKDAIDQVNKMEQVDMVVFSGDMVNSPCENDYIAFVNEANKLNVPWFPAMGNHDIGFGGGLSKNGFLKITKAANPCFKSNKPYYAVKPQNGYVVIFLDGVYEGKRTALGYFPQEEMNWLDEALTKYENDSVIIVQHYPVVEPFKSKTHNVINAGEYLSIIEKHNNVIAILSGHYHGTRIQKVDDIAHVSSPALVEYPNAFRVITVRNIEDGKVQLNFAFSETGLKDIQKQSKEKSKWLKTAEGKPMDQETYMVIDLKKRKKLVGLFKL